MYYIVNGSIYPGVACFNFRNMYFRLINVEKSFFVDQTSTFEDQSEPSLEKKKETYSS